MRAKKVIKNTIIIFGFYIVNILVNFLARKLFLDNIGLEYLGVMGVFTNIITLLSLSDLGVISAITYQLYKPVHDNDLSKIKYLIHKFDIYYRRIAIIILVIGVLFMIPMPYLLKDATINIFKLRIFFGLQLLTTLSGYLFASRKTLLFVYEQHYITVFFETLSNFIFSIVRIFVILYTRDYLLYLTVNILQIVASSIFIYFYSKRSFKFLNDNSIIIKEYSIPLFKDMKHMTISSMAGFIYSSTDNLIISAMIGINPVGLLSNYKLIPQILFDVIINVLKPVQASIGALVHGDDAESVQLDTFKIYTFMRFLIANYICISILLFTDDFISLWFGTQYRLSQITTWLIVIDLFISIVQGPIVNFVMAKGYFRHDRNIMIVGAIINLTISLLLVKPLGINGVLFGTIIAQLYHWFARILMVNQELFKDLKSHIKTSIKYLILTISLSSMILYIKQQCIPITSIYHLIAWAMFFTFIINSITLMVLSKTNEFKQSLNILHSFRISNHA